jgi:pimeloyl-ACP methyl ester carboxylesterase
MVRGDSHDVAAYVGRKRCFFQCLASGGVAGRLGERSRGGAWPRGSIRAASLAFDHRLGCAERVPQGLHAHVEVGHLGLRHSGLGVERFSQGAGLGADRATLFGQLDAATAPAWKTKPSFYLVATEDGMIPPPAQRMMAERAGAKVREAAGSHAIYVSRPQPVADLIAEAAAAA